MTSELFELIKNYGFQVRNRDFSNSKSLELIKPLLEKSKIIGKWKHNVKQYMNDMETTLKLCDCPENTNNDQICFLYNLYLQHGKIPTNNYNNCTLVQLMTVAYYIGQISVLFDNKLYTSKQKKYYLDNELYKITSYVSKNTIKLFDEHILQKTTYEIEKLIHQMKFTESPFILKTYKYTDDLFTNRKIIK